MHHILIADAGATKTNWSFLNGETKECVRYQTCGINIAQETRENIIETLYKVKGFISSVPIDEINYFGAGCATPKLKQTIQTILNEVFNPKEVSVEGDLTGAGKALFGDKDGVACILGTGSASALFSKGEIKLQTPSLGFILGDEGSGVALGKRLLNSIFKRQLSDELIKDFQNQYNLSLNELIEKVYRENKPAPFIASFTHFLRDKMGNEEISLLVEKEFDNFFVKNLLPYGNLSKQKIGFIGSVAYHFRNTLKKSGMKFGIKIDEIIQDPMPGLEKYYMEKNCK